MDALRRHRLRCTGTTCRAPSCSIALIIEAHIACCGVGFVVDDGGVWAKRSGALCGGARGWIDAEKVVPLHLGKRGQRRGVRTPLGEVASPYVAALPCILYLFSRPITKRSGGPKPYGVRPQVVRRRGWQSATYKNFILLCSL
ncbi:MAG: hypothetical protein IJV22_05220 [Bacteroidales bacterium]|nr:hypothetical protein [Bacteroidales bacterium]